MKRSRRPGFTVIEVLAVLGLMTVLLIAGTFVLKEQQLQAEEAHFFINFKAEWEHFISEGLSSGRMQYFSAVKQDTISKHAYLQFDFDNGTPAHLLSIPDSLTLVKNRTVTLYGRPFFTQPLTLDFTRPRNGRLSQVTFGLGWGVFTYKPNAAPKK